MRQTVLRSVLITCLAPFSCVLKGQGPGGDSPTFPVPHHQAVVLYGRGNAEGAIRLLTGEIEAAESREQERHGALIRVAQRLADRCNKQKDYSTEVLLRGLIVASLTRTVVPPGGRVAAAHGSLGNALFWAKRYVEAAQHRSSEAGILEKVRKDDWQSITFALLSCGNAWAAADRHGEAADAFGRTLSILGRKVDESDRKIRFVLMQHADEARKAGRVKEAHRAYSRLIDTLSPLGATARDDLASAFHDLGLLHAQSREYDQAVERFSRALELKIAEKGSDHLETASFYCNLGWAYLELKQLSEARKYLTMGERIAGRDPERHELRVNCLVDLARIAFKLELPEQAARHLEKVLRMLEERGESAPARLADVCNKLGASYAQLGLTEKAIPVYNRALELVRDSDEEMTALVLHNLGSALSSARMYTKAEDALLRSIKMKRRVLGNEHPFVAAGLCALADLLILMHGRLSAELLSGSDALRIRAGLSPTELLSNVAPHYRESLRILERAYGVEDARLHPPLQGLAHLQFLVGHLDKAAELYARAGNASGVALVELRRGDHTAALREFGVSRRASYRRMTEAVRWLSESELLAFVYRSDRADLDSSLSVLSICPDRPGVAQETVEWVLNRKSVALHALTQRAQHVPPPSSGGRRVRRDLAAIRAAIGKVNMATRLGAGAAVSLGDAVADLSEADSLASQEGSLAEAAGRAHAWMDVPTIRSALPLNAVLVEVFRYRPFVFGDQQPFVKGELRYVAWIVPAEEEGKVKVIDLGPAGPIDEAVRQLRRSFGAVAGRGLAVSQKDNVSGLQSLALCSRLLLAPILPEIVRSPHWFISPDAETCRVPWHALLLADDRYVVEEHTVTYLASGADLAAPQVVRQPSNAVIVADPNYDLPIGVRDSPRDPPAEEGQDSAGLPAARQHWRSSATEALVQSVVRRHSPYQRWWRLPATFEEARAVLPLLRTHTSGEARLIHGDDAIEGSISRLSCPEVLLFSTHAFSLDDSAVSKTRSGLVQGPANSHDARAAMQLGRPPPRGEFEASHPLSLCAVVLAGANVRHHAEPHEDGLLSGVEIANMDLSGTKLVVLSACETAVGDVMGGEGVFDLRRAFRIAGARQVVGSLWRVPDVETSTLMISFFEHLSKGASVSVALRQAQLALIEQLRSRHDGVAYPSLWAAFSVLGHATCSQRQGPVSIPKQSHSPSRQLQVFLQRTGHAPGETDGKVGPKTWAALQRYLKTEGLYAGNVDGIPGPLTAAALRELQARLGVPQTGGIDAPTVRALEVACTPAAD
ncbi:MAG: CHAT domain-containing protein [Lentisphaerae bacterium]|nr:CHAT domain-containing protein [Lentisphaerota bacterium]MBT5612086.1 CHAT domain-containing protein [Lentisphaerota bacterium]MBT7060934.1 CHAT domain-containing protein [Lentisphaerota bacterium]MBT7841430.1 CHAT domain-containing protein [Lentisphaerota bacterium]